MEMPPYSITGLRIAASRPGNDRSGRCPAGAVTWGYRLDEMPPKGKGWMAVGPGIAPKRTEGVLRSQAENRHGGHRVCILAATGVYTNCSKTEFSMLIKRQLTVLSL